MRIAVVLMGSEESYTDLEGELALRLAALQPYASPGTELDLMPLDPGYSAFGRKLTDYSLAVITPNIIAKIVDAESRGYDAVIVYCMLDPGVEAARCAVRIPVVGMARVGYHVAATLADKIGIIAPTSGIIPFIWKLVRAYGVEHLVCSVEAIDLPLTELRQRREELRRRFIDISRRAIDRGAQLLFSSGTLTFPVYLTPDEIEKELDVPVLNPGSVAVRMAELYASLSLRHSRAAYPEP